MPITSCVQIGVENVVLYFVVVCSCVAVWTKRWWHQISGDRPGPLGPTGDIRQMWIGRTAIPGPSVTLYLITSPFRKLVRDVDGDDWCKLHQIWLLSLLMVDLARPSNLLMPKCQRVEGVFTLLPLQRLIMQMVKRLVLTNDLWSCLSRNIQISYFLLLSW